MSKLPMLFSSRINDHSKTIFINQRNLPIIILENLVAISVIKVFGSLLVDFHFISSFVITFGFSFIVFDYFVAVWVESLDGIAWAKDYAKVFLVKTFYVTVFVFLYAVTRFVVFYQIAVFVRF